MSKPETLSIDLLRLDGGTQARIKISEETVESYAELIDAKKDWPFGPIDVFHDGSDYFVADGFHRTLAALRLDKASIPCVVHKGTAKDAMIFGMTANDKHGLRMSQADKRACVVWLLDNGPKMTQVEIAEKAGVSQRTVRKVVSERKPEKRQSAGLLSETQGKSSETASKSNSKADAALAKKKAKADAAAAKAKAKAAADAAKEKEKADAKAEREKARSEKAAEKEAAKKAKEKAKADKEAAKAAALTPAGQIKALKNLIQQHIDKAARLVCDLHRLKPNMAKRQLVVKLIQDAGVNLWG